MIETGPTTRLGKDDESWLRFGEESKQEGAWAGRRLLYMRDKPAFELSFWCGTCQFIFRRLEGANEGSSAEDLSDRMAEGLADLAPDVIERFGDLLPAGGYVPLLIEVAPRLVMPVGDGDYFAREQIETWGVDGFGVCRSTPEPPTTEPSRPRLTPEPTCMSSSFRWSRPRGTTARASRHSPPACIRRPLRQPWLSRSSTSASQRIAEEMATTTHTGVSLIFCSTAITRWRRRRARAYPYDCCPSCPSTRVWQLRTWCSESPTSSGSHQPPGSRASANAGY